MPFKKETFAVFKNESLRPHSVQFVTCVFKGYILYKFKVIFNGSTTYGIIEQRYSVLHSLHYKLQKNASFKSLFDSNKLPSFPGKHPFTNYNNHDDRRYRAYKLQQYLQNILIKRGIFNYDVIKDVLAMDIYVCYEYCDVCKLNIRMPTIPHKCTKCNAQKINVDIRYDQSKLSMKISYSPKISLNYLINKATKQINKNHAPVTFHAECIERFSFIGKTVFNKWKDDDNKEWILLCNKNITFWSKKEIINTGLQLKLSNTFYHSINSVNITCKHIISFLNKTDKHLSPIEVALKCPIYFEVKLNETFSEKHRNHLHFFNHFINEFNDKEKCQYWQDCMAFKRLTNGGNRIDDRCHIKIYRHPPRNNRQITMKENTNKFIFNSNTNDNQPMYKLPRYPMTISHLISYKNQLLTALLGEVRFNGFRNNLCFQCTKSDECKHDVFSPNSNNILSAVSEKMEHIRHQNISSPLWRCHMLALMLYTGCDCNHSLCSTQRNGDYKTWKVFDYCLWNAIKLLSDREYAEYKLYSGLSLTKVPQTSVINGYFPTYTSTSCFREVSVSFMGKKGGMVIEFDPSIRKTFICCDVSWISKFPDEAEILIARTVQYNNNNFEVKVLDENKCVQTVLLTTNEQQKNNEIVKDDDNKNDELIIPMNDNQDIDDLALSRLEMYQIKPKQMDDKEKNCKIIPKKEIAIDNNDNDEINSNDERYDVE